ncbi:MAG: S8 family serine peptidase [Planctomycetes bacterium]|nr:S8 family serine peptidase [Planctomycetota bacterium]
MRAPFLPAFVLASILASLAAQEAVLHLGPLPGARAGTERWLVTFRGRSFDLAEYRAAIARRAPAPEVDAVVAGLERRARTERAGFLTFVAGLGGCVTRLWWLIDACAVEIAPEQLGALRGHPDVLRLDPDAPAVPQIRTSIDTANHAAAPLHAQGILGAGATLAVMDSGMDADMNGTGRPHAAFYVDGDVNNRTGGGIAGSRLLANLQVGAWTAEDPNGHGTGVGGVAAGERWNASPSASRGHAPRASLLGVGIADAANGNSSFSTIISGWQRIAAERARYNVLVVNNSYSGSPDPTDPSQQALDALALAGDVLPVCAAGNFGASSTASQSVANGLAVGAVTPNSRVVTEFSSRGPLSGDTLRGYPDLCANGIGIVMPLRDREAAGRDYVLWGTSFASPQVAGAATLYRSVRPQASALETKAALLVTTEDVSAHNPNPPYNTRNAYGLGYLRDDRLIDLARGNGLLAGASLTAQVNSQTFRFGVRSGRSYAVALAWHRHVLTAGAWSNLDLSVSLGSTVLGSSTSPRNLYEKVVFTAPADGVVDLVVQAVSLEIATVPFALAACEQQPAFVPGTMAAFGTGCAGSGIDSAVALVVPNALATAMGNSASNIPFGQGEARHQQIVAGSQLAGALTVHGLAFRQDNGNPPDPHLREFWNELEIVLAPTTVAQGQMTATFANNVTGAPTRVLARQAVSLPTLSGTNAVPGTFAVRVLFDQPFAWQAVAGENLCVDIAKSDSAASGYAPEYPVDSVLFNPLMGTVQAPTATATAGTVLPSRGLVLGLLARGGGAVPELIAQGAPAMGNTYALRLARGRPSASAAMVLGASDSLFGGVALPIDLGGIGAPGCFLRASPELLAPFGLDAKGAGELRVAVPAVPALLGGPIVHQGLVLDPAANPLGLAVSNGTRGTIGGQR